MNPTKNEAAKKFRIGEVAALLNISPTTLYKRISRDLDMSKHVQKEGGVLHFSEEAVAILREKIPKAKKDTVTALAIPEKDQRMTEALEDLRKAVLTMAEELKNSRQDSAAIRTEINHLRQENQNLRLSLMPAPVKFKPVIPWGPPVVHDPLEGMTWYQKAWVQWFEPWKMRRCET